MSMLQLEVAQSLRNRNSQLLFWGNCSTRWGEASVLKESRFTNSWFWIIEPPLVAIFLSSFHSSFSFFLGCRAMTQREEAGNCISMCNVRCIVPFCASLQWARDEKIDLEVELGGKRQGLHHAQVNERDRGWVQTEVCELWTSAWNHQQEGFWGRIWKELNW